MYNGAIILGQDFLQLHLPLKARAHNPSPISKVISLITISSGGLVGSCVSRHIGASGDFTGFLRP